MSNVSESLFKKVVYSLKLGSWPKVLVPYVFSVSLLYHTTEFLPVSSIILGLLYIFFLVVYIVLLNDYADVEVDRIKRAMFPEHCSPKTIPDGILTENQVLGTGILSLALVLFVGIIAYLYFYAISLSGILLSIATFWMYSLRPFRLNYRGGGELLEAMGISIVIPFTIFQLFGTTLSKHDFIWLIPSFFLSLSSAIASGLSDESSDKIGGKRTLVALIGSKKATLLLITSFSLGMGMLTAVLLTQENTITTVSGSFLGLFGIFLVTKMFGIAENVQTNTFAEIAILKNFLHKGIWYTLLFVSIVITIVSIYNS
ncbi:MAG: prenyltransferase [Candidatus Kapabacteria bacterium]|nr:prenyltransferase [Candidatus Kapabacteria bacterium]